MDLPDQIRARAQLFRDIARMLSDPKGTARMNDTAARQFAEADRLAHYLSGEKHVEPRRSTHALNSRRGGSRAARPSRP